MPHTRTIQKEDLFHLHFLNGAALSHDRSQVIYTVNKINADKDKEFSTIYLLDIASGETRQMTNGAAVDKQPAWSPAGQVGRLHLRPGWQISTLSLAGGWR